MRPFFFAVMVIVSAVPCVRAAATGEQQRAAEPSRVIERVAGDVYRVQAGAEATVFVVGSDGILLADPLDLQTAQWLKPELEARFPNRPVLYIVEASPSLTRVGGGAVFKPVAQTIGHDGFTRELLRALKGQPPALAKWVSYPQEMFTTGKTVTLGGKTIQIVNAGEDYRPDSSIILFVEDRVLFTWSWRLAAPFSFSGSNPRHTLNLVRTIAGQKFDTLIPSNGQTLGRSEVDRLIAYLDYLGAEAATGIKRGRSAGQVATGPVPAKFQGDPHLGGRGPQLSAMYDAARIRWMDLEGAAVYSWLDQNSDYCESYDRCESGAQVVGGSGGLRIGNRRFGMVAEMTFTQQFLSVRETGTIDEVFAHRQSRGSLLLSFGGTRLNGPSFNLLAGVTAIVGDSDGVRQREGFAPIGGRRPVAQRATALGVTVGTDLAVPVGNRVSLVFPLRATILNRTPQELWPGTFDAQGGVGLRFNVSRAVR